MRACYSNREYRGNGEDGFAAITSGAVRVCPGSGLNSQLEKSPVRAPGCKNRPAPFLAECRTIKATKPRSSFVFYLSVL